LLQVNDSQLSERDDGMSEKIYVGPDGSLDWERLGFGALTQHIFLDHLRNRAVVRLTDYRHPFVRLCPVSRETNTSGGLNNGVEGLEKANIKKMATFPDHIRLPMERALAAPIVLADPFDLTKMLDIPPGLSEMQGTARMLMKFYATS